ncbi:MOSC domain-containing protein [Salmonirosea aquatica]|uniref:MOSC domain-containing protein n=1 Tax=Salmonirosea aquatica TaxID=2654236 RepID=A0A7C9FXR2_9BACT|nr:MOSC domain-containing protein [Cytophagaceae bacterium SJW1-29]
MTEPSKNSPLHELMQHFVHPGTVEWIGLRPVARQPMVEVAEAYARIGTGLDGDRYKGKPESKRQVSLIQAEHLTAVGSFLGQEPIDPLLTRRNIVMRGINLLALKDKRFTIGEAVLEYTGECYPCSRMEKNLGEGGYNAMRQHGGILARVVKEGTIRVGDRVEVVA